VYLDATVSPTDDGRQRQGPVPAGDLERGAEDLRAHEFGHLDAEWLGELRVWRWKRKRGAIRLTDETREKRRRGPVARSRRQAVSVNRRRWARWGRRGGEYAQAMRAKHREVAGGGVDVSLACSGRGANACGSRDAVAEKGEAGQTERALATGSRAGRQVKGRDRGSGGGRARESGERGWWRREEVR
jgi:hypothetical protein